MSNAPLDHKYRRISEKKEETAQQVTFARGLKLAEWGGGKLSQRKI